MSEEGRTPPASAGTFERAQLDQALAILEREANLGRLPPAERRWFQSLLWYGYAVPVLASALALAAGVHQLVTHWSVASERLPALLDAELSVFVGTVLVFGPLNLLAALCLFPVSAPLLVRTWRWRRRVRTAGLSASLRAPWERERARHRTRNALTLALGPWLVGWGVLFALLQPLADPDHPLAREPFLEWVPVTRGWALGCALFVLPIGLHYVALHFLLRDVQRVALVRRLIHELRSSRADTATAVREQSVLLGTAFRQAARIEHAQIARERLATLRSFESGGLTDYRVRRSAAFRAALAPLAAALQVRVCDQILRLASSPHVDGVRREEDGERRWVDVPGTELEIGFEVDDARHGVIASALRVRAGATA